MRRRLALVVFVLLAIAAPAMAHVEVSPDEAQRGSTGTFTFTVPNEEDNAKTTTIEIFWPENAKFTTVEPTIPDKWTADEKPGSVTFHGSLAGEEEVALSMKLGPLPVDGDAAVFKVLQTYDNGEIVRWIDVQTGREEPPHPAPMVKLTGAAPPTTQPSSAAPTTAALKPKKSDDDGKGFPLILVVGATFISAIGIGMFIGVLQRSRAR